MSDVERRIIAAEVAMRDRLPVIALLFLSRIKPHLFERASDPVRARFRTVAAAARVATEPTSNDSRPRREAGRG